MKKLSIILLSLFFYSHVFAVSDSTWFRARQGKNLKYVLLTEGAPEEGAIITPIVLKRALFTAPQQVDLHIDIYNVLFKDKLVLFSLMPSYKNIHPVWVKIDLDTIKEKTINLKELHSLIVDKIRRYPAKAKTLKDNLKYWNYALLIKRNDGWYCSATDCFTEFFDIIDQPSSLVNASFQINLSAPQLSTAEYEAAYKRKHSYYSTNTKSLMGFNDDVSNGDRLYLSYMQEYKGEKKYHFWLLSEWAHDHHNAERGTDRFVFMPGIGVVSASYDFFMPAMIDHWYNVYNKKFQKPAESTTINYATNAGLYYPPLDQYFTEYTIPAISIPKK